MQNALEEKNMKVSVIVSPEKDGKSAGKRSFWHINREMLPFKLHFIYFIGGMGAILPYQSAIGITKLGLTASNIGAAYTAQQFLFLFSKPVIGYLADYFNKLKATIVGLTILQGIFTLLMIVIPNDGMPKIKEAGFNKPYTGRFMCHFCSNYEAFKMEFSKNILDEDSFKHVLSCLTNPEKEMIRCSNKNFNSSQPLSMTYEIMHIKCNNLFSKEIMLANTTVPQRSVTSNVLYINSFLNSSQHSEVCILPKTKMFYSQSNFLLSNVTKYCYEILDSESNLLQKMLLVSPLKDLNCDNFKRGTPTNLEKDHNACMGTANFKTYQFWAFAICLIISCMCISSIFTISDTVCYESTQGADYGLQRAWGAVSWGIIAPIAGFLNDYTDGYLASWCLMAIFCTLQIWNLSKMNLAKPDFSQNILKDIKTIFSSIEFIAFEVGVFMNGMFTGIIWFYLTWFLTSIGGNKLIIGLAHTIQCFFGEVPTMFISSWLIKKLGHFNLVSLALIFHGIRFFIYSYIHNPWWILPIESLHGFTFGSFYAAMTSYGKLNSRPGVEATTQSVLCATYEALGSGLGCVITGACFDNFGGHTTFFYASFVCAIAALINVLSTIFLKYRKGALGVSGAITTEKNEHF